MEIFDLRDVEEPRGLEHVRRDRAHEGPTSQHDGLLRWLEHGTPSLLRGAWGALRGT